MLVYASKSSSRLEYILDFIGKEIFNKAICLTTDQQVYDNYDGPKINYSNAAISNIEFSIYSVGLLFETGTKIQDVTCFESDDVKAFFQSKSGDFPFDIFSAVFYLLSRYEEYLPHANDKYGRYAHNDSIAYKESFLHLPLVNIWLMKFKKALSKKYPALKFYKKVFTYQPTYDIDIAWSYSNKGFLRNAGGFIKSAFKKDWYSIKDRIDVLFNGKEDPFDSYKWLKAIHKHNNLQPIYFFLLAFKQMGFDKNISPFKKKLRQLIKEHDHLYTTGIHPSWQSGEDDEVLKKEINFLRDLVGHDIKCSRQHYLRFALPATYQNLLKAGIGNDYSMGYGTVNGFRASVASSYLWYDLENEVATNLLIHPFCFMDANAYYELKLAPDKALEQLLLLYHGIKEVNGQMITLWHNNFLGTDRQFAGWREVYERFLKHVFFDSSNQVL